MENVAQRLKLLAGLLWAAFSFIQLHGCATATAGLECGVESMNPTIMAALDSFESAAISIKLSNRILLHTPTTELDKWPEQLYGAPSGTAAAMMGLSLLGSSQGVTIPTELDPQTGFPRPTSALYLFLKDRDKMLDTELNSDDKNYFEKNPKKIFRPIPPKRFTPEIQITNGYIYRNPLMAYGTVNGNQTELAELQEEIAKMSKGFTRCDKFLHIANQQQDSSEGTVKSDYCKDPELTEELLVAKLKKDGNPPSTKPNAGNEKTLSQLELYPSPESFGLKLIRAGYTPDTTEKAATKPNTQSKPDSSGKKTAATKNEPTKAPTTTKKKKSSKTPASAATSTPATTAPSTAAPTTATPTTAPEAQETASKQPQAESKSDTSHQTPPAVTNEDVGKIGQITEKKADLDDMKKGYGKLAGRVYKASVAGADFTMAALTKLTCAIINGARALPNAKNEIEGWKGAYNAVMLLPRIKIIIDSLGYYKTELGLQFTTYKTMYQQIKGTYEPTDEQTPQEKQASETMILRIETAEAALERLEPKLQLLAKGEKVEFTDQEVIQLTEAADAFPDNYTNAQNLMAALTFMTP